MRRLARRLWRWLLWTIGLAAVASIVANLVFVDYHQASRELPKALREYREEGLPWLASDLALPNIRESENAAEPLRRAIAALPKNTIDYNPSGNVPYGILRPVAGYERAFALVAEAVRRPRLDFGRDLDIGAYVLFPEEAGVKHLVRALMGRAELRTRKGDDAGALADLDIARHLVRLIAQDRGMVAALVAASCDGMISGQARRCLVQAANDPARLRRYRDWLARPAPLLDLRRPFRDEIFMAVANARNLDRLGVGTSWNPFTDMEPFMCHYPHDDEPTLELTSANVRRDGLPQALRARAYLARNLQMWTELSRDTNRLREPIEKVTAHTDTIVLRYASPFTTSHIFDPLLFPVYAQFGRSNHRILAARTLALAYADALLLHATSGRWPTSSTVPDPLGDDYLQVRTDKGRFRIWSVGSDGIDGHGATRDEYKMGDSSDDLVAAYPPFPPYIPRPTQAPARYTKPD